MGTAPQLQPPGPDMDVQAKEFAILYTCIKALADALEQAGGNDRLSYATLEQYWRVEALFEN